MLAGLKIESNDPILYHSVDMTPTLNYNVTHPRIYMVFNEEEVDRLETFAVEFPDW